MSHARRPMSTPGTPIADRLIAHSVDAPSGCRIWIGYAQHRGYGRVQLDGGRIGYAHRASYEAFVGAIPAGYEIDHLCRRPRCIRPHHLQAVPASVNVRRGTSPGAIARQREQCKFGHALLEHGVERLGRRVCRTCRTEYSRIYNSITLGRRLARAEAGLPVVDPALMFATAASPVAS